MGASTLVTMLNLGAATAGATGNSSGLLGQTWAEALAQNARVRARAVTPMSHFMLVSIN